MPSFERAPVSWCSANAERSRHFRGAGEVEDVACRARRRPYRHSSRPLTCTEPASASEMAGVNVAV